MGERTFVYSKLMRASSRGTVHRHIRLGLLECGLRVVVLLLAHRLDRQQLTETLRLQPRRGDVASDFMSAACALSKAASYVAGSI